MSYTPLPGQQFWDGVSSYVFGTTEWDEFTTPSLNSSAAIRALVKAAGFTVMRVYLAPGISDSVLDKRLQNVQDCGCVMLAVLADAANSTFNQHVVTHYGSNCLMYSFGNEPDNTTPGLTTVFPYVVATYLGYWNAQIPAMRVINPNAVFFGPEISGGGTSGSPSYLQSFLTGVVSSGVLPDGISFHWYPCFGQDVLQCNLQTSGFKTILNTVRSTVITTLGEELPICLTEWNADPGDPVQDYTQRTDFIQPWTQATMASIISGGAALACQFDACSAAGTSGGGAFGYLDLIDHTTGLPKAQYTSMQLAIAQQLPHATFPSAIRRGSAQTYDVTILADSPKAYYRLNETALGTIYDSSGNRFAGVSSGNSLTFSQAGNLAGDADTCMKFAGGTTGGGAGQITLPTSLAVAGRSTLTIECWFKLPTNTAGTLISNDFPRNTNNGVSLMVFSGPLLAFEVGNHSTNVNLQTAITLGVWHHAALVFNGAYVSGFVDGVPVVSGALTGTIGTPSSSSLLIGALVDTGTGIDSRWNGFIDEVAIYFAALDWGVIQRHYQIGLQGIASNYATLPTATRRQS